VCYSASILRWFLTAVCTTGTAAVHCTSYPRETAPAVTAAYCCCYRVYLRAMYGPLLKSIISQVKTLHATLHSLICGQLSMMSFATWTLVNCCKAPFVTGCTVTLVHPEAVYLRPLTPWQTESWLLDYGAIQQERVYYRSRLPIILPLTQDVYWSSV